MEEITMKRNPLRMPMLLLAGTCMMTAPMVFAGETGDGLRAEKFYKATVKREIRQLEEVVVEGELDTLPDDIRPPDDLDSADTVLLFTNIGNQPAMVKCVAFDRNGTPIGRTATRVPALGLRYVTASDISDGLDFIGQVQCARRGQIVGSVVFIGPGFTDLPVMNRSNGGGKGRIRFPLVVHY